MNRSLVETENFSNEFVSTSTFVIVYGSTLIMQHICYDSSQSSYTQSIGLVCIYISGSRYYI